MYTQEEINRSQEDINKGQRRINYELCEVDEKLIEALKAVVEILNAIKAVPSVAAGLRHVDFNEVNTAISQAYDISKKVADIKPPGCEGPYPN